MSIPDYQSLMLPVLMLAAEGEIRVPVAANKIADQLGLSAEERNELLPSGKQRLLHNRIHWAKFYMSKAGLLVSPKKGWFEASLEGRQLLKKNPAKIDVELLKSYPAFLSFYQPAPKSSSEAQKPSVVTVDSSLATPEEQIEAAHTILHAALRAELLQRILNNTALFFEQLIVDLLVGMGYGGSHENAALRLGKSGDNGIDGIIDEDRLGLDRIYVQAKRYAPHVSVGRPEVQGFVGSLVGFGATKGVFVTTSRFNANAIEYTRQVPQRVVLIDGEKLTELMTEHGVGVRLSRSVLLKRIDEDFFSEE
jgi:restriction system protein